MDVADWLRALGLEQYEAAFRENAVDAETIARSDRRRPQGTRVTSIGHRRQLLEAIATLAHSRHAGC